MPKTYQSKKPHRSNEFLAEDVERQRLAALVRDYEAVRNHRGPEHDLARVRLEYSLHAYGQAFQVGEWIWSWSKVEQSLMRARAMTHQGTIITKRKQHETMR